MRKKLLVLMVLSMVLISITGCNSKNDTAAVNNADPDSIEFLITAIDDLNNMKKADISIALTGTPENGNLAAYKTEKKQTNTLSFSKEKDTLTYEYTYNDTYNDQTSSQHLKNTKDGLYSMDEDGNWNLIQESTDIYYTSIMNILQFSYQPDDMENFQVRKEDSSRIYSFSIKESSLEELRKSNTEGNGILMLDYTYTVDEKNNITDIKVNQKDSITIEGETDTITSDFTCSIKRN